MPTLSVDTVEALLARLYLGGGSPRNEDRKKARELVDLLALVQRTIAQPVPRGRARTLVDAAAGHGYVGLCAAALLGWRRVIAIERDADRIERVRAAATKIDVTVELRVASVDDDMPEADLVVALHACGGATDGVLASATRARARWILCAPCCYGASIPSWSDAMANVDALGAKDAAVRTRLASALVDDTRLRVLRGEGYDAELLAFTSPTVTPHNLAFRARRGGQSRA